MTNPPFRAAPERRDLPGWLDARLDTFWNKPVDQSSLAPRYHRHLRELWKLAEAKGDWRDDPFPAELFLLTNVMADAFDKIEDADPAEADDQAWRCGIALQKVLKIMKSKPEQLFGGKRLTYIDQYRRVSVLFLIDLFEALGMKRSHAHKLVYDIEPGAYSLPEFHRLEEWFIDQKQIAKAQGIYYSTACFFYLAMFLNISNSTDKVGWICCALRGNDYKAFFRFRPLS